MQLDKLLCFIISNVLALSQTSDFGGQVPLCSIILLFLDSGLLIKNSVKLNNLSVFSLDIHAHELFLAIILVGSHVLLNEEVVCELTHVDLFHHGQVDFLVHGLHGSNLLKCHDLLLLLDVVVDVFSGAEVHIHEINIVKIFLVKSFQYFLLEVEQFVFVHLLLTLVLGLHLSVEVVADDMMRSTGVV